jgi:bifunctional DNase/RNase
MYKKVGLQIAIETHTEGKFVTHKCFQSIATGFSHWVKNKQQIKDGFSQTYQYL